MTKSKRDTPKYWLYGDSGSFVRIYAILKGSVAYNVLTASEKLVLIDMIDVYDKATSFGTKQIPGGFQYPYSRCRENISETTFQKSVRRLCEVGFFRVDAYIQDTRPGSAKRYSGSSAWENYKPTRKEKQEIDRFNRRKKNRLAQKAKRATDFRSNYEPK